jgi:DNA polymerase III epsilon subunit-like protein
MKEITFDELLEEFDESVHEAICRSIGKNDATHIVVAENVQLDSSLLGARTAMAVGPTCTDKTVEECEGRWLNDLPSQRQYFVRYAVAPETFRN